MCCHLEDHERQVVSDRWRVVDRSIGGSEQRCLMVLGVRSKWDELAPNARGDGQGDLG